MGMIGRWIDRTCEAEPEVMRRVLNRKFGRLHMFLDDDGCGCLIGSYGLVRGDNWVERHTHPNRRQFEIGVRVKQLGYPWSTEDRSHGKPIGTDVKKRSDEFVTRLLKQRIRKSLGIAPVSRDTEVDAQTVGECRFGRGE